MQNILRCLLLFVKLQAEYHLLCSNLISSAIEHIAIAGEEQTDHNLQEQVKSLDLRHFTVPLAASTKVKKSSISGLSSPKTQKHGSKKGSLFSFFERKSSPEEGNSYFYVDIDQQQEGGVAKHVDEMSHDQPQSQSDVLVDVGLDPNPKCANSTSSSLPTSPSLASKNGRWYKCA